MNIAQHDVKETNRRNVLQFIASRSEVSRSDICSMLGSSMPTVVKITDYLEKEGFITALGEAPTARGRWPQTFRFNPESIVSVGVDYDGTMVSCALCDYYSHPIFSFEMDSSCDLEAFLNNDLPFAFAKVIARKRKNAHLMGVGISMPGNYNASSNDSILHPPARFVNANSFSSGIAMFSQKTGVPVYCCNDVNAAALGEFMVRRGVVNDMVFLSVGGGVGAGLILDGVLRLGPRFMAGEVGYISGDTDYVCNPQRPGWFENLISESRLDELFPESAGENLSAGAQEYVAGKIALLVAMMCNVLDVGLVVVDGPIFSRLDDGFLLKVSDIAGKLCMNRVSVEAPRSAEPGISGVASFVMGKEIGNLGLL